MPIDLTGRESRSVSLHDHMRNTGGYYAWRPKSPRSKVLVKWVANLPGGPWELAEPRKRPPRRRIHALAQQVSTARIVGRY